MNTSAKTRNSHVEKWKPGFLIERCRQDGVPASLHQHSEIELGITENGTQSYIFGHTRFIAHPGRLCVLWGTIAHGANEVISGDPISYSLHIPLVMFMQWQVPAILREHILHGERIEDTEQQTPCSDLNLIKHWHTLLKNEHSAEVKRIVAVEVEARMLRLAHSLHTLPLVSRKPQPHPFSRTNALLEAMMQDIDARHRESFSINDIAEKAGISPSYAMRLFKKQCGVTMLEYLQQRRLATAQHLLATTNDKITTIASDSGFGSVVRFHAVFKQITGQPPERYRRSLAIVK